MAAQHHAAFKVSKLRYSMSYNGSMSVPDQQRTYPSPNPTFTRTCLQLTVVGLREE